MTNWRALCEELVLGWDVDGCDWKPQHQARWNAAIERARALLAQPEPEVVGPSVEELDDLFNEIDQSGEPLSWRAYARAVLSRWGRPAPAPAGEVAELVEWLRDRAESTSLAHNALRITRAADLLERQATPVPLLPEDAQVIEPAQHTILAPAPVPVPVAERLPGPEDCISNPRNGQGEWCWGWVQHDPPPYSGRWRMMRREWVADDAVAWLPATALPLPQVEVQP